MGSDPFFRRRRRVLVGALAVLAVALVAPAFGSRVTSLFFAPRAGPVNPPRDPALRCEETSFTVGGREKLEAWWFRATAPGAPKAVVLVAHGNGWNLERQWKHVAMLPPRGFEVLLFDYRGFGDSEGRVTRANAREDVLAALDVAKSRAAELRVPVVVLGQSMGAALACEAMAGRDDIAAVVLDSPFSSWSGIAADAVARGRVTHAIAHAGLWWTLGATGRDPVDAVRDMKVPLLIVAGGADDVTPPRMARALADASHAELLLLPDAPHVGRRSPEDEARVVDAEVAFFEKAVAGR